MEEGVALDYNLVRSLALTSKCQNKCITCPAEIDPVDIGYEEDLSLIKKEILRNLEEAIRLNKRGLIILLSGGEPFLYSKFEELINFVYNLKKISPISIKLSAISTLNYSLNFFRKKIEIKNFCLDSINVSIHGYIEDHNYYIQSKKAFYNMLKILKYIYENNIFDQILINSCLLKRTVSEKYINFIYWLSSKINIETICLINPLRDKSRMYRKKLFNFSDVFFDSLSELLHNLEKILKSFMKKRLRVELQSFPPCYIDYIGLSHYCYEDLISFVTHDEKLVKFKDVYSSCRSNFFLKECKDCLDFAKCSLNDDFKYIKDLELAKDIVNSYVKNRKSLLYLF